MTKNNVKKKTRNIKMKKMRLKISEMVLCEQSNVSKQ